MNCVPFALRVVVMRKCMCLPHLHFFASLWKRIANHSLKKAPANPIIAGSFPIAGTNDSFDVSTSQMVGFLNFLESRMMFSDHYEAESGTTAPCRKNR